VSEHPTPDPAAALKLEEQLRHGQKMEALGQLAGGIAHDLNNALTAIAGYAELALGQLAPTHSAYADIEEIRRATERAGAVTRQLLAFSRQQQIEPRLFDLDSTIASLSHMLSRLLGPDVAVEIRSSESLPALLGDPGQVEQAVINLAVNARDAMPKGGRLELSTSVEDIAPGSLRAGAPMTPGRYVVLRVSDTGVGMPREVQARIFEPFFTTKDVGKGTGLGLAMVSGTVKQMRGFVFVDSEEGRGTSFRLFFPTTGEAAKRVDVKPPSTPSRRQPQTLLVVEDEPAVRNLVASTLRPDGYQLLLAASADEALRLVETLDGPLDLLLTDAVMPGTSGVELAHQLIARRPGLPVIVMSGYTEETLNIGGAGDPIALLRKPFSPRELQQRIRERLNTM
jgi:two-component system, cell cycle sensor histidine kinase and response regulator CckA